MLGGELRRRADKEGRGIVADPTDQGGVIFVGDDVEVAQFGLHVAVGADRERVGLADVVHDLPTRRHGHHVTDADLDPGVGPRTIGRDADIGVAVGVRPDRDGDEHDGDEREQDRGAHAESADLLSLPQPGRRRRRERSLGLLREGIGQWIRAGPVDRLDQRQQRILRPPPVVDPLDRRQIAGCALGTEVVDLDRDHDPTDGAGVAELGAAGGRSRRRRADDGHDRVRHPQLGEDLVPPRLPAVQLVVAPYRIASRVECACEVGDRPTVPATIVPAVGDEDTGHRTTPELARSVGTLLRRAVSAARFALRDRVSEGRRW